MSKSKKTVFLVFIVLAFAIIAGCSSVVKDNTLKSIQLRPNAQITPMTAELEVSNKKVMGQAKGKPIFRSQLEKEAIAEALKQADGDVLVGANIFSVDSTKYFFFGELTITVIGYPAKYKNFKPKEVCNTKNTDEDILVGGSFYYEDGSKKNIHVNIKNPKSVESAPAVPAVQDSSIHTEK